MELQSAPVAKKLVSYILQDVVHDIQIQNTTLSCKHGEKAKKEVVKTNHFGTKNWYN